MTEHSGVSLVLLGKDYHLGDLLWLTAVLRDYRRIRQPSRLVVALPDRAISRILENNPLIDDLIYGNPSEAVGKLSSSAGTRLTVHDLRILPLAKAMICGWRQRLPWLYYRDLWLEARGQWLATFLGLGELSDSRPVLCLREGDRREAARIAKPYVVLAPHVGQFWLPLAAHFWRWVKGWAPSHWRTLAAELRAHGFNLVTLAAAGQTPVPGTIPLLGLPIRQAAAVIEGASVLVSGESGLWFVAAALGTPFVIVPWWLPESIRWAEPMHIEHRLLRRREASVSAVLHAVLDVSGAHGG